MFTKTNKPGETGGAPLSSNPAQDAIRGAATKPAGRVAASLICADMKINGSVYSEGELQVDGHVEGDVTAQDITIGASGTITGEVIAEVIKVKGTIKGSIRGRKVELETGAKVEGDIVHTSLTIQANAVFEGQVKHATDPLKNAGPKAATNSAPKTAAPSAIPSKPNANPPGQPGNA
ncbi:MAG: polymer-forming cytoskeletal protein [Hyphomonadaceae bacterium]|nr:polymer-forming cytoskeletal protein [Hyphomonadaceae bacterium]